MDIEKIGKIHPTTEELTECSSVKSTPNYNSINTQSTLELVESDEKKQRSFCDRNGSLLIKVLVLTILIGYFLWATYYQVFLLETSLNASLCTGYGFLIILYCLIIYGISYNYLLKPRVLPKVDKHLWKPLVDSIRETKHSALIFYIVFYSGLAIFLIIDTANDRHRLISLSGIMTFMLFGFIMSPFKSQIKWKTILNGMVLQFILALVIIRWPPGEEIFNCIGNKVTTFLGYSVEGAAFVYGDFLIYQQGVFAFKSLCTIYFIGFCINILYYYGIMQKFVSVMGRFYNFWLGTSACESVNSAANIFLGMTEASLLLKPFLPYLTESELHNIMTCGFATTSGTVLAAYISFGANASTLITASVMSAPSALIFSKLMYPETEEPEITIDNVNITTTSFSSVLDAACTGASDAVKMVLNIIAGVIACLSFIYFLNGCLTWFGTLVGFTTPENSWTVNFFVGKLFTPIAFLMGVPWQDCGKVAELIGIKTMVNEFAAFERMSTMVLLNIKGFLSLYALHCYATADTKL
ncbi:hypothetical protein HHI36_021607 [Cryptolaemus montrouzieri]|uniref:Sodium/nucleoside cotransporter n=1 Tax=Cryptolaemus montrouzieri TaxID=559131 RepID=A0ABD2MXR1_9CUCU